MKKLTLLTITALTLAGFSGQSLTTLAANRNCTSITIKGNRVIIGYANGCDIQNIKDQLENCFPNITLPDCDLPDTNPPGNNDNSNDNITEDVTPENGPPEDSTDNGKHTYINEVVNLVNEERAKEGLSPLTIDTKVQAAAQVRATECEQSFSHTRPNGSSFATALKEQNVSYKSAGENIAWGQRSPEAVMNAWMNSPGHRANIMNPNFTTIGVGYYQNANGTNYWCQLFTR